MLATWETPPTGTELSVRAWRSLRAAARQMPGPYIFAFALCLVALGLIVAVSQLPHGFAGLNPVLRSSLAAGFFLLFLLLLILAVTTAAVATHRFILLQSRTSSLAPITTSYGLRFSVWVLAVLLIFVVLAAIAERVSSAVPALDKLVRVVEWIISIVLTANISLIFPAVATEVPEAGILSRIRTSLNLMRGHFWLFVRGAILTTLPVILVMIVVAIFSALLVWLLPSISGDWLLSQSNSVLYGFEALMELAQFVIIIAQAAMVSWLYAWIRQQQA